TASGEDSHFNDRARDARRETQRGVAHVGRLLAEDRTKELFLGGHRRLTLRRDLADQNITWLDLRANIDDPGLVEVFQRLLTDIWNVGRDLFLAQLGVTRHDLELFDVYRGEHVVRYQPLGNQDRILKIVAMPGHERAQDVAPERQLADVSRRSVGYD